MSGKMHLMELDLDTISDTVLQGVGFDTPEGWKDMLEHIGYIKCGKCGDVGMIYDEDSPFCVDCEL